MSGDKSLIQLELEAAELAGIQDCKPFGAYCELSLDNTSISHGAVLALEVELETNARNSKDPFYCVQSELSPSWSCVHFILGCVHSELSPAWTCVPSPSRAARIVSSVLHGPMYTLYPGQGCSNFGLHVHQAVYIESITR